MSMIPAAVNASATDREPMHDIQDDFGFFLIPTIVDLWIHQPNGRATMDAHVRFAVEGIEERFDNETLAYFGVI